MYNIPHCYPGSYSSPFVPPEVVKDFLGKFVRMVIRDVYNNHQNVYAFIHVVALTSDPAVASVEYINLNSSPFSLTYIGSNDIVQITEFKY